MCALKKKKSRQQELFARYGMIELCVALKEEIVSFSYQIWRCLLVFFPTLNSKSICSCPCSDVCRCESQSISNLDVKLLCHPLIRSTQGISQEAVFHCKICPWNYLASHALLSLLLLRHLSSCDSPLPPGLLFTTCVTICHVFWKIPLLIFATFFGVNDAPEITPLLVYYGAFLLSG